MKAVVDTNIWISFLIGKYFVDFYELLVEQEIDILSTKKQVEEILRVIDKPKLRKYFGVEEKEFILHLMERTAELVEIEKKVDACRDKKDNYILEIAVNGKADCIVTGDNDLLVLNPFEGIDIIQYKDFKERIKKTK